jgi:hypothetical protein
MGEEWAKKTRERAKTRDLDPDRASRWRQAHQNG